MQETSTTIPVTPGRGTANNTVVIKHDHFKLESLLKDLIDNNIKGVQAVNEKAKEHGVNRKYRTLIHLVKKYKRDGIKSLVRKENKSKGESRSFSNEALRILQNYFCKPEGGVAKNAYEEMHRDLRQRALSFASADGEEFRIIDGKLCEVSDNVIMAVHSTMYVEGAYLLPDDSAIEVGSLRSARRFCADYKAANGDLMFYTKYGKDMFRNKRQHTMYLNYSHKMPTEYIVGDGKLLDVAVISDDWKRVYRPYLFGWEDMATRRYCYSIGLSETSKNIANSLAVAVSEWGIPQSYDTPGEAKTDNGSAYRSGRFQTLCKHLNITQKFATPKLPRSKPIESLHNIIDNKLKTMIGYTGNKREEMPERTRELIKYAAGKVKDIKKYEKALKEEGDGFYFNLSKDPRARLKHSSDRLMTITELERELDRVFDEYHETIHGGLKKDKLGVKVYDVTCKDPLIREFGQRLNTPNGRYEYKIKQGFKPVFMDPALLGLFCANVAIRKVQTQTGINFNNEDYYHPKLSKVIGQTVLINFMHYDTDMIYVFTVDGLRPGMKPSEVTNEMLNNRQFICIAERQKMIDHGDTKSMMEQLIVQKAELKNLNESNKRKPSKEIEQASNIIQFTGNESSLAMIKEEEDRIQDENMPVKNKYSDIDIYNQ